MIIGRFDYWEILRVRLLLVLIFFSYKLRVNFLYSAKNLTLRILQ